MPPPAFSKDGNVKMRERDPFNPVVIATSEEREGVPVGDFVLRVVPESQSDVSEAVASSRGRVVKDEVQIRVTLTDPVSVRIVFTIESQRKYGTCQVRFERG